MKYFFCFFLAVPILFSASAQDKGIRGVIADSATRTPIEYAAVLLQETTTGKTLHTVLSNKEGEFLFTGFPTANYKLSAGAMGFKNKSLSVIKTNDNEVNVGTIFLAAKYLQLQQVQVIASKPIIEQTDDKLIYNVENDPSSRSSNAIDLLRKTPFVTADGNDNIQLNGQSNFKVLLNGKETALFALNLKAALKGFPGAVIRKIEIITAPSAKYDAEGIGGIINIITEKKIAGSNGTLSAYYNTLTNYQGSANFNIRAGKFGITSFITGSGSAPVNSNSLSETTPIGAAPYLTRTLTGNRSNKNLYNSGALEISYDADSLNTLSAYGNIGKGTTTSALLQNIRTTMPSGTSVPGMATLNIFSDGAAPSWGYGLDYFRKGRRNKTEEFSIRLNAQLGDNNTLTNSTQQDAGWIYLLNSNREQNREYTLQSDYILPLTGSRQFEVGAKAIGRTAVSDYQSQEKFSPNAPFVKNPVNTNNLNYRQQVYSAYLSYNFKLKNYGIKLGVRSEHTEVKGNFITNATGIRQAYTHFIPNVQASRKWSSKITSVLNYTLRLQRPSISNLNPFVNNTDPLNISYGNPGLGAQTFHNATFQTRYIHGDSFAGLTLYGSLSSNMIAQYALFDPITGVTATTSGNIGKEAQVTVIMNYSTKLNSRLSYGLRSIVRYNSVTTNTGTPVLQQGFSGNFFANAAFRFSEWLNISGSGGYTKTSYTVLGPGGHFIPYQLNLGYVVLKDRISGTINFNNFLKKDFNARTYIENSHFRTVNTNINPYRVTYFGLTYNFGNLKENVSRKKGVNNDDLL